MGADMAKRTDISALEDHTGYWMRRASNYVSQAFASKLATKDTTVAEWVLLRLLHGQEACPPSLIAAQMGMTKGAITKLVDRLAARSLVARSAHADDGRTQNIRLTTKGKKLLPALSSLADQNDRECFSSLPAKDLENLQRILKALCTEQGATTIPIE